MKRLVSICFYANKYLNENSEYARTMLQLHLIISAFVLTILFHFVYLRCIQDNICMKQRLFPPALIPDMNIAGIWVCCCCFFFAGGCFFSCFTPTGHRHFSLVDCSFNGQRDNLISNCYRLINDTVFLHQGLAKPKKIFSLWNTFRSELYAPSVFFFPPFSGRRKRLPLQNCCIYLTRQSDPLEKG